MADPLVERFLAVLPEADSLHVIERNADPAALARLVALNPGKDNQIRLILEEHSACSSAANNRLSERLLRNVARDLGPAKLQKMIDFYQSSDVARADLLFGRLERGETLSDAEQGEADRIIARYPLEDFTRQMGSLQLSALDDRDFAAELAACESARDSTLAREKMIRDELPDSNP
ncbi:hypothetical protein [Allosphingosinicella deserti]|nr:hypothetical protein [Sphingomonas deserti]